MIELYKDGDHMAIKTDAMDEREFLDDISELFSEMIGDGKFIGVADEGGIEIGESLKEFAEKHGKQLWCDWAFQFNYWLGNIVDICCKYRGYKNSVHEKKVLIAGTTSLSGMVPIASTPERFEPPKQTEGGK